MTKTLRKFTSRNFITDRWLNKNPGAMIECWNCNKLIPQDDPKRKYCNNACKKRYWRAARKVVKIEVCEWCNSAFELSRKDKRYCSRRCRDSARRKRLGVPTMGRTKGKCGTCEILFIIEHPQQKYCTFKCFYINRLKVKREAHRRIRGSKITNREVEVTAEEIKETMQYMKLVHNTNDFDIGDWRNRAKEAEKRLVAKYGVRRMT